MKKKILFISGTRADFGKLKSLITEVEKSGNFEYEIFVTGMHMLAKYGPTYIEIERAGFQNLYKYINQDGAIDSQMDLVLANTIVGLSHYIREFRPDLIVVHGDRIEALAGAIVGALNNILIAHIEGGELSGTVDELIRHSVSKLSHIHFVSNEEANRRLIQMGEAPSTVFVIGSPDIDVMLSNHLPPLEEVKKHYDISFSEFLIFVYHPVTTEIHTLIGKINKVLNALIKSNRNYIVIYPNNDKGSEIIIEAYERLKSNSHFRIIPSMRFEYYLSVLKNAQAVIGNSSAGIREAPVYGIPTINIGSRQWNRFQYDSIINVPEEEEDILRILKNIPSRITPSLHFGKGNSAKLFVKHLSTKKIWQISPQKQFRDLNLF
jgi:UDP-N-acetylglucosamine 2-epimerase (hydrolysing)